MLLDFVSVLRPSGLKLATESTGVSAAGLGLATEWIEMVVLPSLFASSLVSVLRPSGLKCTIKFVVCLSVFVSVLRPSGLK